jgi:Spy/CpxP family protein refolding chaperone
MRKISGMGTPPLVLAMAIAVGLGGTACPDKSSGSGGSAEAPGSASAATSASAAPVASASASAAPSGSAAGPSAADQAKQAEEDEQVADELRAHHRHHHQGFAGFVLSAVDTLGVGADQQAAIDTIRKDFRVKMKPLHEANVAVLTLLADGIAAGTIDKAKVDAAVGKAAKAAEAVPGATHDLLGKLHAALKPEQRAALVDKVDAHWAAWKDANANEHAGEGAKADHRMTHLAKEIGLTSDQVDKLKASLDAAKEKKPFDAAAIETYQKAFDAGFVEEKFDAKKLPPAGPESARLVSWGTERMASFYEALAAVLTPDQRPKVAELLKQRAAGPDPKDKQ